MNFAQKRGLHSRPATEAAPQAVGGLACSVPRPFALRRRWQTLVRASSNLDEFSADVQRKFQRFVKEQRLDDKASKASRAAKQTFEEVSDSARRAYTKIDAEFNISSKAQRAARQAEESWRDVEQQYSIRRRLRAAAQDVQRQWPIWSQRASEFSQTPAGKVAVVLLLVVSLQTGFFFTVLNWLLLLWWLSIPLGMALGNAIRKKQVEQMEQAAEEYSRRQQEANPFAGFWSQRGAASSAARGSGSSRRSSSSDQQGPVIDAEWNTIDDDTPRRPK